MQKSTFKNGSKKGELDYKEGLIISTKSWRKDGSKNSEMYYKDGYRKSQKTWYSNGQINLKERYKRKGDYRSYYHYSAEGQLIEKGHKLRVQEEHRDRLFKVGKWFYYFDDGKRKLLEYYTKKGDLEKVRNYDAG